MKRTGLSLRINACPRCGGAAYRENADEEEWRCLQCARPVALPETATLKDRRPVAA